MDRRQGEMLANRLRKRARHLSRWARRAGVSCYRLYDRDIPEVPLVVDWYEGRLHVSELARRRTRELPPSAHDAWIDSLVEAAAEALSVRREDVFVKHRDRQRGRSQYERVARRGARFVVHEGGHRFWVNLSDYLDTGLFLDHRETRARVGGEAEGRRVLNLFAYTGAFTVYAAAGGARSTTSVDLSRTYLDWTRQNLELNDLDGDANELVHADALRYLDEAVSAGRRFDLVVLDPPTFSNSKRMDRSFDVQRDHPWLVERALRLVDPGGGIYLSTNSRRFKLAASVGRSAEVEDLSEATIPPDFRDRRVHRCYRLVRRR